MPNLPCDNGAGSLNNPSGSPAQLGTNNPALAPYVAPTLEVGQWQISGLDQDACARADRLRQETYIAEALNISGAPINIFKLLGVHQQDESSLKTVGSLFASTSAPGFPVSGINSGGAWRSIQTGASVVTGQACVGLDFGYKTFESSDVSLYEPRKSVYYTIGCIYITQSNDPQEYARQVRVEITDGTCEIKSAASFVGAGSGTLTRASLGSNATEGTVIVTALADTSEFSVMLVSPTEPARDLGIATVGQDFNSTSINFRVNAGTVAFEPGDTFFMPISWVWKRAGIFNLTQSPSPQLLNFQTALHARAFKIIPTLFTGSSSWEVLAVDANPTPKTAVTDIQDSFFNENRDRDYSLEPVLLKVQYNPTDSSSDLSRFGLSIMDQYTFTASYAMMVTRLGRPIVVGDVVEVIPELQYDTQLRPVRKFLEVTDASWAADGFSPAWAPLMYRFTAQQALPSQETRDIFGTIDTEKYLTADSLLVDDISSQVDISPLTTVEEIIKETQDRIPKTGSDDGVTVQGVPAPIPLPPISPKPEIQAEETPPRQAPIVEDGLPPGGMSYGEGFKLPETTSATDGEYFRLYYPPETSIPPRLYRFSAIKNRWIYQETDRRGTYSSYKPSIRNILESTSNQPLNKK